MLPVEVALHSVRVGLAGANAGRDSFGPVAVRLRNGHRLSGPPAVRESSETAPIPIATLQHRTWTKRETAKPAQAKENALGRSPDCISIEIHSIT